MAIAKYERRGWRVLNWYPEPEDVEPDEYEKERRVGDPQSWVIALDASESAASEVESVRFAVGPVLVLLESRRRRRVEKLQDSTL